MLDLLEKFEQIEIKNETRLAAADKEYCEKEHSLYIKVLKHYRDMFETLQAAKQQNENFYDSVSDDNDYYNGSYKHRIYGHKFIEIDKEEFAKIIENYHTKFINRINRYFADKYNVTIKEKSLKDYKSLEKPESPNTYHYRNMTDKELDEYKKKEKEYQTELDNYYDNIINAELNYNSIVDDIFTSLGGFSFGEKAENEIKESAAQAIKGRWDDKPRYEIKNSKISFNILFSHKSSVWDKYRVDTSSPDYHAILRALTYFDSDSSTTETYATWIRRFCGYEQKEEDGIYDNHHASGYKVHYFKYFKNGKWDVTFDNHANALNFARKFLKYTA